MPVRLLPAILFTASLIWAQARPPMPPPQSASEQHERDLQDRMDALHRLPLQMQDQQQQDSPQGTPSPISVLDLSIPEKPRGELEKGVRELQKRQFDKAASHFQKALVLYPKFVAAHNDLGVVYMYKGDNDRARQEFEAALGLNDRNAVIYDNLSRTALAMHNFRDAEAQAAKAAQLEPHNPEVLTLLAFSQFSNGDFADAVTSGRMVHQLEHKKFAIAHVVVAYALESQNQLQDAEREYELFVQEDPGNPRAPLARARAAELAAKVANAQAP